MSAICLLVAGVVQATIAAPEFTLAWTHSVQKIRWEERYRVVGTSLVLREARAEGTGAGLDLPPDARRDGDHWSWRPDRALASITLSHSPFGGDYRLCWAEGCRSLAALVPEREAVTIAPCASLDATRERW